MSADADSGPVILVVAFPISIHAARWVNTVRRRGWRMVLFPSVIQRMCPEFEPARPIRSRVDLETLQPGEIGVYSDDDMATLTDADLENPETYPHALPVIRLRPDILPGPDALCEAIAALRPDLVHSMELQHGGYLVLESKRRLGGDFPPWLASSWGSDIFLYRKLRSHRPTLRSLLGEIDALHSDCARDILWASEKGGFQGVRFPQMPASGGVDFADFPNPADLPPPSQRKTIMVKGYHGWAGRGLHILLAIHLIASELRGFRIIVTHSGKPTAEMVERLAVEDRLNIALDPYLGSNAEAIARLASARMAVGYGISDGISTTLLEAMAVGTFMIQANTCCGNEWISNGRTGLIVPPHDVVALSEAILLAATNDELVDEAVAINRRVVEERWNALTNGAIIDRAYREIIANHADA